MGRKPGYEFRLLDSLIGKLTVPENELVAWDPLAGRRKTGCRKNCRQKIWKGGLDVV